MNIDALFCSLSAASVACQIHSAKRAVCGAGPGIMAHNHPDGGAEPSHNGIRITAQLMAAGQILDVKLLVPIIFNRAGYFGFLDAACL